MNNFKKKIKLKKQLNMAKKEARRLNEMNRKKNLMVSFPSSHIEFDANGKVCRFVNKTGDVLPTDTEMFGCEIVRTLPNYVNDFIKQIGLGVVIKVPVQDKKGLTGSGERKQCHRNSRMMSLAIGGHRLLGYCVKLTSYFTNPTGACRLFDHSVWISPEGKAKCVTDYSGGNEGFVDDRNEILFLPISLNQLERLLGFALNEFIITEKENSTVLEYDGEKYSPNQVVQNPYPFTTLREDLGRRVVKKGYVFPRYNQGKYNLRDDVKNSHFGKVSLFTGRSWDYYKNKIINTYFPTPQTL